MNLYTVDYLIKGEARGMALVTARKPARAVKYLYEKSPPRHAGGQWNNAKKVPLSLTGVPGETIIKEYTGG